MATNKVQVTEGTGTYLATNSFTEDAVTKHANRVVVNDSSGAEVLGAKTDNKSSATDTTSVSLISLIKQVSSSIQAAAASLAGSLTVATHAVTQSGTWTVQPGNTANTTAWKVDGSAVTQPVSGTVTVQQSTASNLKVDLSGTAANSTAIKVDGSAVTQPVSNTVLTKFGAGEYETVAASQTTQSLGATGGTGDYISGILVVPATTSPGNVLLRDGSGSDITLFAGGASSVSNLVPFFIPLGMISTSGAWKVTTGSSVSCIGIGDFT